METQQAAPSTASSQPTSLDPQAVALAQAIRQTESGNNPTAKGASGEYGAYQWEPGTWAKMSAAAGVNVPLQQATPEQQNQVAYTQIKQWKDQGYNVGQIASMWNAGEGDPNAYINGNAGTNSQGVAYDTKAYAQKVATLYQQYKSQAPQAPVSQNQPQPSLISKLGNDAGTALEGVANAGTQTLSGQINPVSGLIQGAGAIAGGITSGLNDAATSIPVVGGLLSGAEGLLGKGVQAAANTAPGQAVTGAYNNFAQAHPELAGDIGGAANVAGLAGLVTGGGEALTAAKEGITGALGGDVALNKALDVVAPKETAGYLKAAIKQGRTSTGGLLGTVSAGADADTVNAAKALTEKAPISGADPVISKLKPTANVEQKANAIRSGISTEANALKTTLDGLEVKPILTDEDLTNMKSTMEQQMKEGLTIGGNTEYYGDRVINKFFSLLPQEGDITASDILEARQGLDRWAQGQKVSPYGDAASAKESALGVVRDTANKTIYAKAPDVAVQQSLSWQARMYKALDNVANANYKEVGTTGLGRFAARHPVITGAARMATRGGLLEAGMKGVENLF